VRGIEAHFQGIHAVPVGAPIRLRMRRHTPLSDVARTLFKTYRTRTLVGLTLMASQAFFYNAIFFTYALVLTEFYGTPANAVGWYILPFAVGNVLGPILLGHLFDTLGRRVMIASTYAISGILLAGTAALFAHNLLSAQGLTGAWMIVFFFASAAASSAYLTVSEIFPLEIRALAIAFFYAIGTGIGGIVGPLLLGALINTGSRGSVAIGYVIGAVLMVGAAVVEALWGIDAERKSLESVARPLALADRKTDNRVANKDNELGHNRSRYGACRNAPRSRVAQMRAAPRHRRYYSRPGAGAAGSVGSGGASQDAVAAPRLDRRRTGAGLRTLAPRYRPDFLAAATRGDRRPRRGIARGARR